MDDWDEPSEAKVQIAPFVSKCKDGTYKIIALHLACAENVFAEVFLTTDDKFLNNAKRNRNKLSVRVENPVIWLMEVMHNASSDDES